MKSFLLISLLLGLTLQVTIKDSDQCSACLELKSQSDCENPTLSLGCEWTNSTCAKKATINYKEYCEQITDPATKCSKTPGCAYIESKCTHFTGCTAYVKTTQSDCQTISYKCTTNGVTCDDVQECSEYSKEKCESSLSINSPYKCKLENDTCRNYKCTEADISLTTNDQCSQWLSGCVTTGMGCIDTRPPCAQYTGTVDTCSKMIGQDGKCTFDTGTVCKSRICSEAKLTTWDDTSCNDYKSGCKSTGFSCVDNLISCTSYQGNVTTCVTYKGSDGQCVYDSTATKCRAKKCEDKVSGILSECQTYLSGCLTNGVTCVTALQNCNKYTGTKNTCKNIIGLDGKCKGTSDTDSTAFCALKTCADDDLGTENSDIACQTVQNGCKTTGMGCVSVLSSCVNYTDDGNGSCLKMIGSEGKCKAGTGGKCAAKICADNTTATTNKECNEFQTGCVTTGSGCGAQAFCADTLKQTTCEGTDSCSWSPTCVSATDCTQLNTKSLCFNYKTNSGPCIWDNGCRLAKCSDFQSTDDTQCNTYKNGCISNGTKCADPTNCETEFTGTKETCEKFKALCTNTADATADSACKTKSCTDAITTTSDSECQAYLADCLFAGTNKCILKTAGCSEYTGTKEDCSKYTGYVNSTTRVKCYSVDNTNCVNKQCSQASGMTSNEDCNTFLDKCIYNGDDSCVTINDECSSYKYKTQSSECQQFKGDNGTVQCYDGTNNNCKNKECSDATSTDIDTDQECQSFMSTCVYNGKDGTRCVPNTDECDTFVGTTDQCNQLKRNNKQCTKLESCTNKICTDKTNATSNNDCLAYHSNCRLVYGAQTCKASEALCTGYVLTSTTNALTYCSSITTTKSNLCSFDPATTANCVSRQCNLWTSALASTISCVNYLGLNTCSLSTTGYCYQVGECSSYTIPSTVTTGQALWCGNLQSSAGVKCTYSSGKTCTAITTCDTIPFAASIQECIDLSQDYECTLFFNICLKYQYSCDQYPLSSVPENNKSAACSTLLLLSEGTTTQCAYVAATSTSNCVDIPCQNIQNPTSQVSCDLGPYHGCRYYSGQCLVRKGCSSYTIPSNADTTEKKKLFCQNMYDNDGFDFCSYDATLNGGNGGCAAPKECINYTDTDVTTCQTYRDKSGIICTFANGGEHCISATGDDICGLVSASSLQDCQLKTQPDTCYFSGGKCIKIPTSCTTYTGNSLANCANLQNQSGNSCTYIENSNCSDLIRKKTCDLATENSIQACQNYINQFSTQCTWKTGTTCSDVTCEDVVAPKSYTDCWQNSIGCVYSNGMCVINSDNCYDYTAKGNTSAEQLAYCNKRRDKTFNQCTYISNNKCTKVGACTTYYAKPLQNIEDRMTNCKNALTTDPLGCTYFSGEGCMTIPATCNDYTTISSRPSGYDGSVICPTYKNAQGLACLGVDDQENCEDVKQCSQIQNPTGQADCEKYNIGCFYHPSLMTCLKSDVCENLSGGEEGPITFCKGVVDIQGNICRGLETGCATRKCDDPETLNFTTNAQCQAYSNKCKSNSHGCIDVTKTCIQQQGIASLNTCQVFLDELGNNCQADNSPASVSACKIKQCEDNPLAKSQQECDTYYPGGECKWKNPGCLSKTSPCYSYQGTQTECGGFKGNDKSCWSDSQSKGACRDRKCEDKVTATNDSDCSTFMTGCVYNGIGCVAKGSACSAFKGTKDTCSKFDTNSASNPCWSLSSTTGPCINKQCQHLTGTKDSDCEAFLPKNHCITDGKGCIQGPKPCSYFKGNADTCPTFTSSEGICKTGLNGYCAKRECYEAPNNLTKDSQCNDWSSGCVTSGKGCTSSFSCTNLQTQTSCAANVNCQWATSCRVNATACSSLNGQSICVNNVAKKCAWYNNTCRDPTCVDLDSAFNTHKQCNDAINGCTTTGAGCITQGICSSYTTKTMCEAAETTESTKKCTWANAQCRIRQCSDQVGTSDEICNTFLSGCKTNGTTCIGAPYNCSVFSGNQSLCLSDSNEHPCLYVNGTCYNYYQCTDVQQPSQSFCNSFSSNCVEGVNTCISINQCSKYTDQVSCYKGINGTTCGWLPPAQQQTLQQKCAEFKQCSDVTGTTLADCIAWNSNCVSDGTNCITINDCTSYTKELSCIKDKSKNNCFWTGTTCKIKQCSDVTATTDAECSSNIVKEGICTTDGTKCVLRSTCKSYTTEASCTIGSDAIPCVFNYPLGQTTGNKTCIPKECTDIIGATNDQCIGMINNKPCVSNGKNCVSQGTCSSYKNKLSCAAGGSDNSICVFSSVPTTADPLAGTCKPFNSCSDASGDSNTCQLNKSCKYTEATKKCETTDCITFNTNGQCNPFPTFDGKSQTLCFLVKTVCTEGDPTTLSQGDCYSQISKYTYTWNQGTSKCQSCKATTSSNNTTNSTVDNNQTTENGYFLSISFVLLLLGTMI